MVSGEDARDSGVAGQAWGTYMWSRRRASSVCLRRRSRRRNH